MLSKSLQCMRQEVGTRLRRAAECKDNVRQRSAALCSCVLMLNPIFRPHDDYWPNNHTTGVADMYFALNPEAAVYQNSSVRDRGGLKRNCA